MKQHFPWMCLLPLIILVGPSIGGFINDGKCDSDGILGTFNQTEDIPDSLTITPVNFTKQLKVVINKADDQTEKGVQIYVVIDTDDSSCKDIDKDLSILFTISDPTKPDEKCEFTYKGNFKANKHTLNTKNITLTVEDPYQASFEVRRSATGEYTMVISDPSQGEIQPTQKAPHKCFAVSEDKKYIKFNLTVNTPATLNDGDKKELECGIQLEMKGSYAAEKLTMNDNNIECPVPGPGCDNMPDNCPTSTATNNGSKDGDSNDGLNWWQITLIVVGAVLLLLLVVGAIVYFVVIRPKKEAAAANEDIEAESAVPEDPPVPEDALETPEEQQNNKSEDESQDA